MARFRRPALASLAPGRFPCPGIAPITLLGQDRCMEMRAELVISAPAEDAWAVVGERFGEIGEWASAITKSVMDGQPAAGQVRTCPFAGLGPLPPVAPNQWLTHLVPH